MNVATDQEKWTFLSFESAKEGKPIQSWFDGLPEDHRDAVKDILATLQVTRRCDWEEPLFDPLIGEGGEISEIRVVPVIVGPEGRFVYRIYGFFGEEDEESYKFLHAVNKKVGNDKHGKAIAKRRLGEFKDGQAQFHAFSMDSESSSA